MVLQRCTYICAKNVRLERRIQAMKDIPNQSQASPGPFSKKWRGIVFSSVGLALIVAGVLVTLPHLTSTQAANAVTPGDWPMYMHDAGRTDYNSNETIINLSSAPHLRQHWAYRLGAAIFSQPVVASGLIYWGSFDGYEHATNLSGQQIWSQKLGGNITQCAPVSPLGIVSSAAVVNGVVYVGGSDHQLYALNASNGHVLWHALLRAPNTHTFLWDSPLVVNNTVYIGTATTGESAGCKLIAGQFFALNASTGSIVHTYNSVPAGCVGGGIWSSPVYDASDGSIYFTAGTQGNCNTDHISIGIVKLNASNGSFIWQDCLPGTVLGAVTDTGSRVLAVVDGTALTLVNALTGANLYNNTANKYYGSPSISNGVLYVGSKASGLFAFGT